LTWTETIDGGLREAVAQGRIRRVSRPTPQAFQSEFLAPGVPVLIENAPPWPASIWNPTALAALGQDVEVTLELGDVMYDETRLVREQLDVYLRRYLLDEPTAGRRPWPPPYLSVFDLLDHFPSLRDAMDFSLFAGAKRYERVRAWLGPAGTLTGFHYDIGDNLLHQVFGSKQVTLVPPSSGKAMYPSRKYDFMSVLSGVDERHPERFPLFLAARSEQIEVTVEPGQTLFIPKYWWHRVRGLSGSISVNCFGWSRSELPRYGWEIAKYALHDLGLWGRRGAAHCVCHAKGRTGGTGLRAKFLRPMPAKTA
jgi:hypothetical protein